MESEPADLWDLELGMYTQTRQDPDIARRKRQQIECALSDPTERAAAEGRFEMWLRHWRTAERDTRQFARDPLKIDRFVIDLRESARQIPREVWPRFHEILEEVARIAEKTSEIRRQMRTDSASLS